MLPGACLPPPAAAHVQAVSRAAAKPCMRTFKTRIQSLKEHVHLPANLMCMRTQAGASLPHVMVKVPATWAGLQATRRLEGEGIRCLVTLVTSAVQAAAACDAGATILATCESGACVS